MEKIKSIMLCLWNQEEFRIPAEYIGTMLFRGLKENVKAYDGTHMFHEKECEEVFLVLLPKADTVTPTNVTFANSDDAVKSSLFQHLENGEGCYGVTLEFEATDPLVPPEEEEIDFLWEEGSQEFINTAQTVFRQNDKMKNWYGALCLHVGHEWKLCDMPSSHNNS